MDNFSQKLLAGGWIFYALVTLFALNIPFFWDSILTSTVAQWFYYHGIGNAIVPLQWDAGHPPFFQIYLMLLWKIFGKNLLVSHLALLPFLGFMVYGFILLINQLTTSKSARIFALIFYLLHPYLLTQSTLVSYDIVQIGFFQACLIGLIKNSKNWFLIGIWGLSLCSIRGQIMAITLIVVYLFFTSKSFKKNIGIYLLAIAPLMIWNIYHWVETGWMLSTPSSSWANQRTLSNTSQFVSHLIGIARCFTDYGVVSLSIVFTLSLKHLKYLISIDYIRKLILATGFPLLVLLLIMLVFSNPIGHRYFMFVHVSMILCLTAVWNQIRHQIMKIVFIVVTFTSGHFWLYPSHYSNGWDVTLRYISYERNRASFFNFIQQKGIPEHDIASAFPLFCSQEQTNLIPGKRLLDVTEIPQAVAVPYIAQSAVCNDIKELSFSHLPIDTIFGTGLTRIILYKNQIRSNED